MMYEQAPSMEGEVEAVTRVIREGIERRGFFIAINGEMNLIAGNRRNMKMAEWVDAVERFAQRHGWRVRFHNRCTSVEFQESRKQTGVKEREASTGP